MVRLVQTACPLDCPDACSLTVTVEEGRVTKVEGDERNPLTAGLICGKVRGFGRHLYGEHRVATPLRRRGAKGEGSFDAIGWDEALDTIAARLRADRDEHGGESILPFSYGGSNGLLSEGTADKVLFARLGASRLARTVCAAPSGRAATGLYGKMAGVALRDYVHAELIVVWGANPHATGIHLVPIIDEARARGAKLVVVDPRRTPLAKRADVHLAVRPGTDLPVALGVINWLFTHGRADDAFLAKHATGVDGLRERARAWDFVKTAQVAGVPAEQLALFARMYADASPAVIRCGWGPERNRNGGSATAAILALPAVAGKFGVRGGGYTMSNSRAFGLSDLDPGSSTRTINMNRLGRELLEAEAPPIRSLFVYNCNPLTTMPDQNRVQKGLAREDLFTVVFDAVMTDTTRYADIVLPATTFLEHEDLALGYGALVVNRVRPAIEPVHEARSNVAVFSALLGRLGLGRDDDPQTPEAWEARILGDRREILDDLSQRGVAAREPGPIPFVDAWPHTPDRKVHLLPPALDAEAGRLYEYRPEPGGPPLALISPATSKTVSSTFGQLDRRAAAVAIHPDDARERGIADGAAVRVHNDLGHVDCLARVTEDTRPGVVVLAKGIWAHNTDSGTTSNALCGDALADLGGGATFNDARVHVEPR